MAIQGIDVHGARGKINWPLVRQTCRFAYVKVSEGATWRDERRVENLRGARNAGILVGPYHYARADLHPTLGGAQQEANNLIDAAKQAGWDPDLDGRLVLDLEEGAFDLTDWALEFCRHVEKRTGTTPIIYSYPWFIDTKLRNNRKRLHKYPLWLADWGPNDGAHHDHKLKYDGWNVMVHQYTSRGTVPGAPYPVDRNDARLLAPLRARPEKATLERPADAPKKVPAWVWKWVKWRWPKRFLGGA